MQYSCPNCENDLDLINPGKPFWACAFCEDHWTTEDLEEHYDNEKPLKGTAHGWRQCMAEDIRRGIKGGGGSGNGGRTKKETRRAVGVPEFLRLGEACENWEDIPVVKVAKEPTVLVTPVLQADLASKLVQLAQRREQKPGAFVKDMLERVLSEKFSKAS